MYLIKIYFYVYFILSFFYRQHKHEVLYSIVTMMVAFVGNFHSKVQHFKLKKKTTQIFYGIEDCNFGVERKILFLFIIRSISKTVKIFVQIFSSDPKKLS